MTHTTKTIARSTMTRTWGDPGSGTGTPAAAAPAAAPATAASGSSGGSGAGGGAATPASGGSIAGAMQTAAAAAGITGGATTPAAGGTGTAASGAAGGVGAGQPGVAGAAAATPATLEAVLAAHPELLAQHRAREQSYEQAMRWATWAQQEYRRQQTAASNPQTQGTGTQPQPQQKVNPFGIPNFDRNLLKTFIRGQDGSVQPGPFTPPGAVYEYQQWQEARMEAMEKFLDDPWSFFEPLVAKAIESNAPKFAQQQIGNVQNSSFANNYVSENQGWLFVQNNGRTVHDNFGNPVLSEHGKQFKTICETLQAAGVSDIRMQQQLAENIVFGQAAIARIQQGQTAATQHQQQNGNLLTSAAAALNQPQPGGGVNTPSVIPNPTPPIPQGGVRRMKNAMLQAAQAGGLQLDAPAA